MLMLLVLLPQFPVFADRGASNSSVKFVRYGAVFEVDPPTGFCFLSSSTATKEFHDSLIGSLNFDAMPVEYVEWAYPCNQLNDALRGEDVNFSEWVIIAVDKAENRALELGSKRLNVGRLIDGISATYDNFPLDKFKSQARSISNELGYDLEAGIPYELGRSGHCIFGSLDTVVEGELQPSISAICGIKGRLVMAYSYFPKEMASLEKRLESVRMLESMLDQIK